MKIKPPEYHPIETCPKEPGKSYWVYDEEVAPFGWIEAEYSGNKWLEENSCCDTCSGIYCSDFDEVFPTHWVPLPLTPTENPRPSEE